MVRGINPFECLLHASQRTNTNKGLFYCEFEVIVGLLARAVTHYVRMDRTISTSHLFVAPRPTEHENGHLILSSDDSCGGRPAAASNRVCIVATTTMDQQAREETSHEKPSADAAVSRPIFGSLGRIVAEDLSQHTQTILSNGLQNMPATEHSERMQRYIDESHNQAIDLFDIYNERSIFNPHFIRDTKRRARIERIYSEAIDAKSIRDIIVKDRKAAKGNKSEVSKDGKTFAEASFPSQVDLDSLRDKLKALAVRKEQLDKKESQLQTNAENLTTCEDLLDDIEKRTVSAGTAKDVEHVRTLLSQADTAKHLSVQAKEIAGDLKKRKRKGVPPQRRKRASFGTRYKESVAKVDPAALAGIVGKLTGKETRR